MSLLNDFRYARRVLARSPLFALTSICSLAVGIAASTAIFSLSDAMLLRPRTGIADPSTLVDIGRSTNGQGHDNFGYPLFEALRDGSQTVEGMSAIQFAPQTMSLGDAEVSERVYAGLVSGTYFDIVGARAAVGRFFVGEEDRTPDTYPVVVLNHTFWTRRFAADRSIVGRTIRLNGRPYTVVGVAEPGFSGTTLLGADFWVPFAMEQHVRAGDTSFLANNNIVWHTAIGRLKPGATIEQARLELDALRKQFMTARGDSRTGRWAISVVPSARIPAPVRGPVVAFLGLLGGLTGLVLLIACSNVAGMLLARALERRREVATRLAVGASRGRVVRQLLVEGSALALAAAAVSVPLTIALVQLLTGFQPSLPIPIGLELQIDPRVIGFGIALSMLTTIAFALLPALHATRFDVAPALHGATSTADRRRAWLRHTLVGAQVAMALLLLVAAGLFMRSLQQAANVDPGFRVENVDTVLIDVRLAGYRGDAAEIGAIDDLVERFRAVPGVTSVGAARMVPLQGGGLGLGGLRAPGYRGPDGTDRINSDWNVVTPDYFRALDVPIVRGRSFAAGDRAGAPLVAIINERMAGEIWPGEDPIGRVLMQGTGPGQERPLQIVGVAKTGKYRSLSEAPQNYIYVPQAQQPSSEMTFFVRRQQEDSQIASLRQAVRAYNPALPIVHAETLDRATAIGLLPQRLAAWIAGTVGSVGLLLAALGLYGLTAFSVAQRTREIAVRMALGASQQSVLALILRQSGRLAITGGVIGLALAVGVSLLLRSLLIGIEPIDPVAFALAIALLGAILFAASWAPAKRASAMDPMRALRSE